MYYANVCLMSYSPANLRLIMKIFNKMTKINPICKSYRPLVYLRSQPLAGLANFAAYE